MLRLSGPWRPKLPPHQNVLNLNGAPFAITPVFTPLLYQTNTPSPRPQISHHGSVNRIYHSTANPLPDGRVMPAGSNTNRVYKYEGVPFPTELALDAFSPSYLAATQNPKRPNITLSQRLRSWYPRSCCISVTDPTTVIGNVDVIIDSSPFTTHSLRMLTLQTTGQKTMAGGGFHEC